MGLGVPSNHATSLRREEKVEKVTSRNSRRSLRRLHLSPSSEVPHAKWRLPQLLVCVHACVPIIVRARLRTGGRDVLNIHRSVAWLSNGEEKRELFKLPRVLDAVSCADTAVRDGNSPQLWIVFFLFFWSSHHALLFFHLLKASGRDAASHASSCRDKRTD